MTLAKFGFPSTDDHSNSAWEFGYINDRINVRRKGESQWQRVTCYFGSEEMVMFPNRIKQWAGLIREWEIGDGPDVNFVPVTSSADRWPANELREQHVQIFSMRDRVDTLEIQIKNGVPAVDPWVRTEHDITRARLAETEKQLKERTGNIAESLDAIRKRIKVLEDLECDLATKEYRSRLEKLEGKPYGAQLASHDVRIADLEHWKRSTFGTGFGG